MGLFHGTLYAPIMSEQRRPRLTSWRFAVDVTGFRRPELGVFLPQLKPNAIEYEERKLHSVGRRILSFLAPIPAAGDPVDEIHKKRRRNETERELFAFW
jgi:hypothetical protein